MDGNQSQRALQRALVIFRCWELLTKRQQETTGLSARLFSNNRALNDSTGSDGGLTLCGQQSGSALEVKAKGMYVVKADMHFCSARIQMGWDVCFHVRAMWFQCCIEKISANRSLSYGQKLSFENHCLYLTLW